MIGWETMTRYILIFIYCLSNQLLAADNNDELFQLPRKAKLNKIFIKFSDRLQSQFQAALFDEGQENHSRPKRSRSSSHLSPNKEEGESNEISFSRSSSSPSISPAIKRVRSVSDLLKNPNHFVETIKGGLSRIHLPHSRSGSTISGLSKDDNDSNMANFDPEDSLDLSDLSFSQTTSSSSSTNSSGVSTPRELISASHSLPDLRSSKLTPIIEDEEVESEEDDLIKTFDEIIDSADR